MKTMKTMMNELQDKKERKMIMKTINAMVMDGSLALYGGMMKAKAEMESLIWDEEGDTNFISILVLLGISLALAGVFLTFKDQVLAWVDENVYGPGGIFHRSGGRGA